MREILTIVAGLLVLLLTAALVGPYFVDWSAQRAAIDAQISEGLGVQATTDGPIGLTLLPTPTLTLAGLKLAGVDPKAPTLSTGAVSLELAIGPLLRGDWHFTDAKVDTPRLTVSLNPDGSLAFPMATSGPADLGFERLTLVNGSLHILDAARQRAFDITAIDLDAQIDSLNGPFKGSGALGLGGPPISFRFSTAAREGDRLRVKIVADESTALPKADLDGALVLASGSPGATRLRYEGSAIFSGRLSKPGWPNLPWRLAATASVDAQRARADTLEIQTGEDDRSLVASGRGEWAFASNAPAQIDLTAKQLDLDRFFAQGSDRTGSAARLTAMLAAIAGAEPGRSGATVPVALTLASPTVLLGGDTLTGFSLAVQTRPTQPTGLKLQIAGPGRSRLDLDGTIETGTAALFRGRAAAGAADIGRFTDWLNAAAPDLAARLKLLPFRSLDGAGQVEVSGVSFVGRSLAIKADRSTLGGTVTYTSALGADRARLFADLNADALDLDGLPDLTGPGLASAGLDLALSLNARAVRLARLGDSMVDAGRIALKLTRTADRLKLDNFSVADLGGASLTATGEAGAGTARGDLRLDAARLGDLADLIRRVAPGPGANALASRATALSPARVAFHVEAQTGGATPWQVSALTLDGTLRGSHLVANVQPGAGGITAARFSLDSADTPILIRQIGGTSLALSNLGASRIAGTATGSLAAGFDASLDATLANTDVAFRGRVAGAVGDLHAIGSLRLKSSNVNPLAQILAIALPDATTLFPADLSATVDAGRDRVTVAGLTGQIAALPLRGDLVYAPAAPADTPQITGALAFDRVAFATLAGLALGPAQPVRAGAPWSDVRFGAALADPPRADIRVTVPAFDWAEGWTGQNASLRLRIAPGLVGLDDVKMKLNDADLAGHLALRRDGAGVALSGQATLGGLRIDRPSIRGTLSGSLDFSATGTSPRTLVAGLAGTGKARVTAVDIPRADPAALDRVRAVADADRITVDEATLRSTLAVELDKAPLALPPVDADLSMAGGVLRFAPATSAPIRIATVTIEPTVALDWRALALDQRVEITSATVPKDWTDTKPPSMIVTWKGPVAAPQRDLEAGPFINGLSSRAIGRETKRVEAFDADIRERAAFNRRLKASRYLDQRDREIKAFLDDQARQQALDAARAERERQAAQASGVLQSPPVGAPFNLPGAAPPAPLPGALAPSP